MVETIYTGNLHHLSLRMLKVYLVILDKFFLVRQTLVTDIFHKFIAPASLILFNSTGL